VDFEVGVDFETNPKKLTPLVLAIVQGEQGEGFAPLVNQ
jgi:hypothetical protein